MIDNKTIEKLEELYGLVSRMHKDASFLMNPLISPIVLVNKNISKPNDLEQFLNNSTRKQKKEFFKKSKPKAIKKCYEAIVSDCARACELLEDFPNRGFVGLTNLKKVICEIDQTLSEDEVSESQQVAKIIEKTFRRTKRVLVSELAWLEDRLVGELKWVTVDGKFKEPEPYIKEQLQSIIEEIEQMGLEPQLTKKAVKEIEEIPISDFLAEDVEEDFTIQEMVELAMELMRDQTLIRYARKQRLRNIMTGKLGARGLLFIFGPSLLTAALWIISEGHHLSFLPLFIYAPILFYLVEDFMINILDKHIEFLTVGTPAREFLGMLFVFYIIAIFVLLIFGGKGLLWAITPPLISIVLSGIIPIFVLWLEGREAKRRSKRLKT